MLKSWLFNLESAMILIVHWIRFVHDNIEDEIKYHFDNFRAISNDLENFIIFYGVRAIGLPLHYLRII